MKTSLLIIAFGVFASHQFGVEGACTNPKITPSTYSTTDAFFHISSTFIVEFLLNCDNGVTGIPLYAELNGKLMTAAVSEETGKYQVSWTEEHENARAGTYTVNIYDEDGYAAVRKAVRNSEDISSVKALGTATINHPGASKGQFFTSESLIMLVTLVLFYFVFNAKSAIQS